MDMELKGLTVLLGFSAAVTALALILGRKERRVRISQREFWKAYATSMHGANGNLRNLTPLEVARRMAEKLGLLEKV
jgi:hypothetical protein